MHTVIVIGRDRFDDSVGRFSKQAEKSFEFLRLNFIQYSVLKSSRQNVLSKLEEIFIEKRKEDIGLFYLGHGQENGWTLDSYRDLELVEYEKLAFIFAGHQGNLILINGCCFAGAAKQVMDHHYGDYLLIAAMPEDKYGYTHNFLSYIFNDWSNCRNFFPGQSLDNNREFFPIVYGNENLQRLFFPKMNRFGGVCL